MELSDSIRRLIIVRMDFSRSRQTEYLPAY